MACTVTNIAYLPQDVWRSISDWILFYEVGRLYICGNSRLNDILVDGGVHTAAMIFRKDSPKLFWPNLVSRFRQIRHFTYHAGAAAGDACYFPCKPDLQQLGPALESLFLKADGAEHAFFATPPNGRNVVLASSSFQSSGFQHPMEPGEPLDLGLQWPRLHTLIVAQFLSFRFKLKRFSANSPRLPSTLTHLNLKTTGVFDIEPDCLPASLLTLKVRMSNFSTAMLSMLPPGLTHLSFDEHRLELYGPLIATRGSTVFPYREHFPNLTRLSFSPHVQNLSQLFTQMPASLVHLTLRNRPMAYEDWQVFARATHLHLNVFVFDLPLLYGNQEPQPGYFYDNDAQLGRTLLDRTRRLRTTHAKNFVWDPNRTQWIDELKQPHLDE